MKKLSKDDAELVSLVESRVSSATGLYDSRLSSERAKITRYYDGLEPKPLHQGDSSYISPDVYDGVESMRAQLLEVFAGDQTPIAFAPQSADDEAKAMEATEVCSHTIFRMNDGFGIFRDALHDGLTSRVGIAKVWWDEDSEDEETEVRDVSYQDFEAALATDPEIELTDLELDSETQTVKRATMVKTKDISQVRIELVPPEEFGITKRAKSAKDANIVFHRRAVTADALVRMGAKPKDVKSLKDDERYWQNTTPEYLERHQETDDSIGTDAQRDQTDTSREIDVKEAYCRLDLDGRPALWMLVVAGNKLLIKKKVKRLPFVFFVALPRPHSFWGSSFAKKLIPTQNARTMLTRSIINHALITNNPRTGVVKGGVSNPKELTDNRIGGIVNLNRPDALVPIVTTGLNPFVYQTIELLDSDKEQTTGVSRLSQGLNKDAVSKQNSAEMVSNMVALSQVRQKITARNFAEGFVKALYHEVYRLLIENEKRPRLMQIAGSWTEVDASQWPERDDLVAEVAVGYGEKQAEIQRWMAVDTYLGGDQRLSQGYTPEKRYNVLARALRAGGIRDLDSIFTPPDQQQPAKPSPKEEAELAEMQARTAQLAAQAEATKSGAALRQVEMQHEQAMMGMKREAEMLKLEISREQHVQKREMFMLELEAAKSADKTSGILSPDA